MLHRLPVALSTSAAASRDIFYDPDYIPGRDAEADETPIKEKVVDTAQLDEKVDESSATTVWIGILEAVGDADGVDFNILKAWNILFTMKSTS